MCAMSRFQSSRTLSFTSYALAIHLLASYSERTDIIGVKEKKKSRGAEGMPWIDGVQGRPGIVLDAEVYAGSLTA